MRHTSDEARKFILIAINERLGLFPRLNSKLSAQGGNIFSIAFATREELEGQYTIGLRDIDLQVGGVTPEHERFGRERWGECGHNIVHPVASEPVGFSDGIDSRAKDFCLPVWVCGIREVQGNTIDIPRRRSASQEKEHIDATDHHDAHGLSDGTLLQFFVQHAQIDVNFVAIHHSSPSGTNQQTQTIQRVSFTLFFCLALAILAIPPENVPVTEEAIIQALFLRDPPVFLNVVLPSTQLACGASIFV
ncbi:MAG TPA: hypothetical protein VFV92_04435 [Candidatus Bathyarchaeia archaeon]|nr:hypothetical protein [Candidatus Bathyarchaeia archaeon]